LRYGSYESLDTQDGQVLSYLRKDPNSGQAVLVALNMSNQPKTVSLNLKAKGIDAKTARPLLANPGTRAASVSLNALPLPPFATFVGAID